MTYASVRGPAPLSTSSAKPSSISARIASTQRVSTPSRAGSASRSASCVSTTVTPESASMYASRSAGYDGSSGT